MSEKKIVDYTVVESREIDDLINCVKFSIDGGWSPVGSIHSIQSKYNRMITHFYQAMVKHED